MDALSNIISLLQPHDCVAGGLEAGDDWGVRFEHHAGLKCNAVVEGRCWLRVEGLADSVALTAGDSFILPKGRPFSLSSHTVESLDEVNEVYQPEDHGHTVKLGQATDFYMVGSRFLLSGSVATILLRSLPSLMVVRAEHRDTSNQWILEQLASELRDIRDGSSLATTHLCQLLLISILREHIADGAPQTRGWISATADRNLSKAINAIHANPSRKWTVEDLASEAGLSRTAFAVKFKAVTGTAPLAYLTEHRMLVAASALVSDSEPISKIAYAVGYTNESSFSIAFKRVMGASPRAYAVAHSQ